MLNQVISFYNFLELLKIMLQLTYQTENKHIMYIYFHEMDMN